MKSILIGAAGHQGASYLEFLQSITELVAVVDPNYEKLLSLDIDSRIKKYKHIESALALSDFDLAVICVPHVHHYHLTKILLKANKYIIKEKPFSTSHRELSNYLKMMQVYRKPIFTVSQRNNNMVFKIAQEYLPQIGSIKHYHYQYHLAKKLTYDHWRNDVSVSKGGVILDMGYHALNVIVRYFKPPLAVYSQNLTASASANNIETFASLTLFHEKGLIGHLTFTNLSDRKQELLRIVGTKGIISIAPTKLSIRKYQNQSVTDIEYSGSNDLSAKLQLADFINNVTNTDYINKHIQQQIDTMNIIFAAYDRNNQLNSESLQKHREIL